ncbi:MAG TPA: hypothetical protein VJ801_17630 [Polyangia bacterium]|nr:hypothetical protein [Polyangia bacterium]
MTAAEALGLPGLIHRVAGATETSPTTVRAILRGKAPGRVKGPRSRILAALAGEGVVLAPTESAGGLRVVG